MVGGIPVGIHVLLALPPVAVRLAPVRWAGIAAVAGSPPTAGMISPRRMRKPRSGSTSVTEGVLPSTLV
jgi:hypothetical protein